MNKKYSIAAVILALAGTAIIGVGTVAAQSSEVSGQTTFVQQLAQKLGVDQSKVQGAVDEIRTVKQTEMKQKMEEKLNQAVTDGKITEAQKQTIQKKFAEHKAEREADREAMKTMTPEERKAAMGQHRTEMETWAKENGINLEDFMFGKKIRGDFKGGMFIH